MRQSAGASRSRALAALALALVALAGLGVQLGLMRGEPRSHCFSDETHSRQQARAFAEGRPPLWNGEWASRFPPLYALVVAPARAWGGPDGFDRWSRVVNVLLVLASLVPLYRLARLELGRPAAVGAAALALWAPWLVYTRALQSESLFLPLVACALWSLAWCCRRPGAGRGLVVGLVVAATLLTKSLALVLVPAALAGVLLSGGPGRGRWRAAAGLGAGVLLPLMAWFARRWWWPGSEGLPALDSYLATVLNMPLESAGHYLHWLRAEQSCLLIGLTPLVVVPAAAGVFARLRDADPSVRGAAVGLAAATVLLDLEVSAYIGQIASWCPIYHERYFSVLWPLLTVAALVELGRPRAGPRARGVALALGLALLAVPDAVFDERFARDHFWSAPSFGTAVWLAQHAGLPLGVRLVYGLPLLLLCATGRARRPALAAAIALVVAYQGAGLVRAFRHVAAGESWIQRFAAPELEWLRSRLGPGDVIVCHGYLGVVADQAIVQLELPYCIVGEDLQTNGESGIRFDPERREFRWIGRRPPEGRAFLLTREDLVARLPFPLPEGAARFGDYVLAPIRLRQDRATKGRARARRRAVGPDSPPERSGRGARASPRPASPRRSRGTRSAAPRKAPAR
jgi:hypothetical protein